MITFGATKNQLYSFTKDAAANDYPIFLIELNKKLQGNKEVIIPEVKEFLPACVGVVGQVEVGLVKPLNLIDFSGHLPDPIAVIEVLPGLQTFEILAVELPMKFPESRFFELAVIPGTVYGVMWRGLIKATADYHRCQKYWADWEQPRLPFPSDKVVDFKSVKAL